jgi:epoxyqueuosine reductase QueG
MDPSDMTDILEASLREAGVPVFGLVGEARLGGLCAGLDPALRARYGLDQARGAVAAALPYAEIEDSPAWVASRPGPRARLARFARADWYGELVARLKDAASIARRRLLDAGETLAGSGADWRCLANSGLPEREIALAAGIGSRGRNGLVMLPAAGAACVLGVLLLPISPAEGEQEREQAEAAGGLSPVCAACRRCVDACPGRALDHGFDRESCLQAWSTRAGKLPEAIEAVWKDRLYGCDSCLEACPHFRPDPLAKTGRGLLGPSLPVSWFSDADEDEIRAGLKGSALGLRWMSIEAFRRNAELARRWFDEEGRRV